MKDFGPKNGVWATEATLAGALRDVTHISDAVLSKGYERTGPPT